MKRACWHLTWLLAAAALGCGNPTAHKGSTSGTAASTASGGATGAVTGGSDSTTSAGSASGSAASSSGAGTSSGSGSTSSTGSTSGTPGSTSGSTGACFIDGTYVGVGNASMCCTGQVDSQGYCGTGSAAGSTGGTTSSGGWHPPDAGYWPPAIGDGGTTVLLDPTAPANADTLFGGPDDPGNKPSIVYPADGVVIPPNMNSLEIHFLPGAGQTVFEIAFHAPTFNLTVYTGCKPVGAGCYYAPEQTFWDSLVEFARGTAPVSYTIRGVNGASPGVVGSSAPRALAFSDQDLIGGIYYWNDSGSVQRYDWGYPTVPPETWMNAQRAGASFCVGCHQLSRNGDRAVVGKDIPQPAAYTIYDVATRTPIQAGATGSANFSSFSPDSSKLLYSDGFKIGWKDLNTGAVINDHITDGTMPDWAPSGQDMVFANSINGPPPFLAISTPGVDSAAIRVSHFNGTGWDPAYDLVPFQGANNYYPSYSPTGDWVIFNRSPANHNSFDNVVPDGGYLPDGELWTVPAAGGSPLRLDNATNDGALQWPKWAPVVSDYYGGHVMWLTFSSSRTYGLRDTQHAQLWMVAFDPDRAAAGLDPSLPPFYLPFQDSGSGNHIAQWVVQVARPPCTQNTDCPTGQVCHDQRCVPQVINHLPPRPPAPAPRRGWLRQRISGWLGK